MCSDTYVEDMRKAVRINHNKHNGEISDLVEAAKADLQLGGIITARVEDETDMLIKKAITAYIKAEFGLDNSDAGKYRESFESLKNRMAVSDYYIVDSEVL